MVDLMLCMNICAREGRDRCGQGLNVASGPVHWREKGSSGVHWSAANA